MAWSGTASPTALLIGCTSVKCRGVLAASHLVAAVAVDHLVGQHVIVLMVLIVVLIMDVTDSASGQVVRGGEVCIELLWRQGLVMMELMLLMSAFVIIEIS